jgi:hypothetical protein
VRFVVDKVALEQVYLEYFFLSLSKPFHHCSILIFIYTLFLPEGKTGEI